MNPRPIALLSAVVIALLAGCGSIPTSPATPPGTPTAPPTAAVRAEQPAATTTVPRGPEASLEKGMPAETVQRIMGGAPAEIAPMKTAAGNAEVWVYRRSTQGPVRQVQVGTKSIPIAWSKQPDGQDRVTQSIDEPILRMQFEIFDETIKLLMFGGQYLEQNRTIQRRFAFQ